MSGPPNKLGMNRRDFLALAGATPHSLGTFGQASRQVSQTRPNVVLIMANDLGYGDVGCYGCPDIPTPHIDSIARTGVRFTDGYVSNPLCCPSRAGLMTGRYQNRFGFEFNFSPYTRCGEPNGVIDEKAGLPLEETTLAEVLKGSGYKTGLVGMWHLGIAPHFHPFRRGFDEFFGFLDGAHSYLNLKSKDSRILRGVDYAAGELSESDYLTDVLSREAAAFVGRHHQHPFFLCVAYNAPHVPIETAAMYLERVRHIPDTARRNHAAMVSAVDDGVGAVLGKLRETGVDENTLVFFLSINGASPWGSGRLAGSNAPLRGHKAQFWEGGLRVPFLARWPGRLKEASVYTQPVMSFDIFSTAAAAAGAQLPRGRVIDGVNLLPYLDGNLRALPHEFLFWRELEMIQSFDPVYAVRSRNWKLLKMGKRPHRLYDLSADIGETRDVASQRPDVLTAFNEALARWETQMAPPRWQRAPWERPGKALVMQFPDSHDDPTFLTKWP